MLSLAEAWRYSSRDYRRWPRSSSKGTVITETIIILTMRLAKSHRISMDRPFHRSKKEEADERHNEQRRGSNKIAGEIYI